MTSYTFVFTWIFGVQTNVYAVMSTCAMIKACQSLRAFFLCAAVASLSRPISETSTLSCSGRKLVHTHSFCSKFFERQNAWSGAPPQERRALLNKARRSKLLSPQISASPGAYRCRKPAILALHQKPCKTNTCVWPEQLELWHT